MRLLLVPLPHLSGFQGMTSPGEQGWEAAVAMQIWPVHSFLDFTEWEKPGPIPPRWLGDGRGVNVPPPCLTPGVHQKKHSYLEPTGDSPMAPRKDRLQTGDHGFQVSPEDLGADCQSVLGSATVH